ncbi:MAG: exodeoxyribonuclease VII large subunit [Clostridiales Family XIII bacterium]|jgi:exodeoxyribonuclease VII large subunit|nr:exodeoxyribonuclease VII large subunit [Clostridiales Family XIII bacterium]
MAGKPVPVGRLNAYIKRILSTDPHLGNIAVIGEISNLNFHSSGHVYFSLKDAHSKISCVLWRSVAANLRFRPENGMTVVADGNISVYEKGGTYSLNIRQLRPEGAGSLAAAFEKLKEDLKREGLFAVEHKKPLPAFPKNVAIVTSPTGAAVEDMLSIITEKNSYVNIRIFGVLVQGPQAARQSARAIRLINERYPDTDVMIIGRGGGSIEELWAYNEEVLARAIYESAVPVISAVGHETDVTIADFVADVRAETPTAAAHLAVPDTREIAAGLNAEREKLAKAMADRMHRARLRLDSLKMDQLLKILAGRMQYERRGLAARQQAMRGVVVQKITTGRTQMALRDAMQRRLSGRVSDSRAQLARFTLRRDVGDRLTAAKTRVLQVYSGLEALSPEAVLARGYAALTGKDGKSIRSVREMEKGDAVTATMADGSAQMTVDSVELLRQEAEQ